jgi:hypothetical protein
MLPKIEHPIYTIDVPSLKSKSKFRPFLVKEEKLLLMAKESENPAPEILSAVKQIVNNCSLEPKFDTNKLTIFDLEYIFLKLRAVSVDNLIKVAYKDNEDEKIYEFEIDLNKIEIIFPEKTENIIKINEKMGVVMKHPSAALYEDKEFLSLDRDYLFELIIRCIDKIYDGEDIYETKNYTKKDIEEFLEGLNTKVFEKIQEFLVNTPKIQYKINYKNAFGNDREIILSSLNDFFTWR